MTDRPSFPYADMGEWRPTFAFDSLSNDRRDEELRAFDPDFPLLHLLGDLEHEQWIDMFEPWMHAVPSEDAAYCILMRKSFEELTPYEREIYCTRWARIAQHIIETECRTTIRPVRFEAMERQEWEQTTHWVSYMLLAWNPEKVQRWRALARLRYAALSPAYQASDRDMARRSLLAATGLWFGPWESDKA